SLPPAGPALLRRRDLRDLGPAPPRRAPGGAAARGGLARRAGRAPRPARGNDPLADRRPFPPGRGGGSHAPPPRAPAPGGPRRALGPPRPPGAQRASRDPVDQRLWADREPHLRLLLPGDRPGGSPALGPLGPADRQHRRPPLGPRAPAGAARGLRGAGDRRR